MQQHVAPPARDPRLLDLPHVGQVVVTDEAGVPYTITDADGRCVEPVSEFIREISAGDMSPATCRSYAYDLLRWWRFLVAIGRPWDQAQRTDVRDLIRWLRQAENPQRGRAGPARPEPGTVNPRTGKRYLAAGYAAATINHQLAVLASFYDVHMAAGRGPRVHPVPPPGRGGDRPGAHTSPMYPVGPHRRGNYRQKVPERLPRAVTDELWDELFASMTSNRDRAILATYISTGARAGELLGMRCGDLDFGLQTITVIGKGTRTSQVVPASPDAFVWIRLYLAEGYVAPPDEPLLPAAPLWVTLRRPTRPLTYTAVRAVLNRANAKLGTNLTLHDLRHTCALRMASDPNLAITDVQAVLRHRHLTSTQLYTRVRLDELVARTREHHARRAQPRPPVPASGYAASDLAALFGDEPT
jgi:integrase